MNTDQPEFTGNDNNDYRAIELIYIAFVTFFLTETLEH